MLSASMDPASMAKQSDLNPPEKSKIPTKKTYFFNLWATSTHLLTEF